ncbi:Na/Pi symporter [Xanthobacter sp. V4C-4]|uniref:Na/Pi symporter n=1 Tax=Xanthobacter cornucopiae TaxID=3119924 RepID=UPI003726A7F0
MTILAEILAGLGLLFVGLKLLSSHLQQATGRGVRRLLRGATRSPVAGLLSGSLAGAATQSSNAVAIICGNLVRGGVLTTRDAIAVVAGGNVGTAALVFVAAFDFRLVVLYFLALVGFGFQFRLDRRPPGREWMGVALGLALALLGLDFIKQGPRALDPAALSALAGGLDVGLAPLVGFAAGLAAAALSQSSSTPTILVLALLQSGMMGLDTAFFVVVGANLGSGLATLIAAGGLEGTGRQLCYVHILVKGLGCLLMLALWGGVALAGADPEGGLAGLGGGQASVAISLLFLALQVAGAVPVAMARGWTEAVAIHFSPPTLEDGASRPRYIHDRALEAPATALDLSDREIRRLIQLLPTLLPDLDMAEAGGAGERLALWRGAAAIAAATDQFLSDLIGRAMERESLDIALGQQGLMELIRLLQDTLHDLAEVVESYDAVPQLAFNLSESLRTIVLSLADADNPDDYEVIAALTADRSELLNRIRRGLVGASLGSGEDARRLLLATSLFERATWLIRRIAVALRPAANDDKPGDQTVSAERKDIHAH